MFEMKVEARKRDVTFGAERLSSWMRAGGIARVLMTTRSTAPPSMSEIIPP